MLIGQMLGAAHQRTPDKVALWFGSRKWTYAELDEASDRIAASLARSGVKPGDRVALFMPNCPELVLTYFACFKLGAISVPLNYRYRQAEAHYALEHSGATTLLAHQALVAEVEPLPLAAMGVQRRYLVGGAAIRPGFILFADLLAGPSTGIPVPAFDERQPAAVLYTSGTTAKPKGVVYSHGTLWHQCLMQTETFAMIPEDIHLVSTAACHAAAFTGQLLPNVNAGGTTVLTHLPTPEQVVDAIHTHRITRLQMLPASLEELVEYLEQHPGADLGCLRCCNAGGDKVPLDLHHRFRKAVGFDINEVFGMTEALTCLTNPPFGPKRLGSIGQPVTQTHVRLVDLQGREVPADQTGEMQVKSPGVMVGYWNDPEATAAVFHDGWLATGDLARRDEDGYYWFVGRKKEIIIRGGSNISPQEVEEVLDDHPAVSLSCVVGVPDKHFGEIVAAYVALREDASPKPTAEELRQFVAGRIAAYKVPERITLMDHLPLNATGKVDRKRLHALVLQSPK